jgi:hypothetical protein
MSIRNSNSPRSVSEIDAQSIKVPPVSTSPEVQQQQPVPLHQANPAGEQLLDNYNAEVTSCSNSTVRNTASAHTLPSMKPSAPDRFPDQSLGDQGCQSSIALIKRIHDSVKAGFIERTFTVYDVEKWITENNIRKGDGTIYKKGYVATLLSSSYIGKKNNTNRNSIWLDRRFNKSKGVYEYWFYVG